MKKILYLICAFLLFIGFLGCTIGVDQPTSATSLSKATSPPITSPGPNTNNTTPSSNATLIPITWADLDLTGNIIYSTLPTGGSRSAPRIQMLNLQSGEIKTIFTTTGNAWIYYLTTSPDAKRLAISYSPPSQAGSESTTSLYILPLEEGATPQILFNPPTPSDRYIQVEWSPDGKYLYFVHYNHNDQPTDQPYPDYQISRVAYPNGQPEKILGQAFWPRISADSSKLVYVSLDPVSGLNRLFLANVDGSNSQEVLFSSNSSKPDILDAPIFAPDGQTILFSAPSPVQAYQPTWLDRLAGVMIARAHNIPSDWWSVPLSGGNVTRLTQIQTIKLFASISPDQDHIASMSGEGIFIMDVDGSNLRQILFDPGVSSVISWIP